MANVRRNQRVTFFLNDLTEEERNVLVVALRRFKNSAPDDAEVPDNFRITAETLMVALESA